MLSQRLIMIQELQLVIIVAQTLSFGWGSNVASQSVDERFGPGYHLQEGRTVAACCSVSNLLFARVVIDREEILGPDRCNGEAGFLFIFGCHLFIESLHLWVFCIPRKLTLRVYFCQSCLSWVIYTHLCQLLLTLFTYVFSEPRELLLPLFCIQFSRSRESLCHGHRFLEEYAIHVFEG